MWIMDLFERVDENMFPKGRNSFRNDKSHLCLFLLGRHTWTITFLFFTKKNSLNQIPGNGWKNSPSVQTFPVYLESRVPRCHPKSKITFNVLFQNELWVFCRQDVVSWEVHSEVYGCNTHWLALRTPVSLRSRKAHSSLKTSLSWRARVTRKAPLTLFMHT